MSDFMKIGSILMLVIALALTFDGCKKETLPTASFTYDPSDVMQYDAVQFTSTSKDADSYVWLFGGSLTVTEENPVITFPEIRQNVEWQF